MAEFALIDRIVERAPKSRSDVLVGIGDDAAVLTLPAGHQLVVSTDTLIDGVHFPRGTRASDIGWKSLAVNLSDLAAMGASPAWVSLALTLPEPDADFVDGFMDGFGALAAQHHVALIGGDTTRGDLAITLTVHGFVPEGKALLRGGAQAGDQVFVTGTLGDAAAGLQLFKAFGHSRKDATESSEQQRAQLIERLNRPTPQIAAGQILRGLAAACIDISDGLLADLAHVARRSNVAIEIDVANLPASSALYNQVRGDDRLALQLGGGDDYELAFTVPSAQVDAVSRDLSRIGCGMTRIGRVLEGTGVRALDEDGVEFTVQNGGWDSFQ
ncbi:MAG: thiamine-phosphate kinase [Dokdonella sp.]